MNDVMGSSVADRIRGIWGRRWRMATAVFVLLLTAGLSATVLQPKMYRASVDILVDLPKVPDDFVGRGVAGSSVNARLQVISQELLSRTRLEAVIEEFNLYPGAIMDYRLENMRRSLRTEVASDGGNKEKPMVSFNVSYQGTDPALVAAVTNRVASLYVEEHSRLRQRQVGDAAEFLEKDLKDLRLRLDQQENRVSDFRKRHSGELPEQALTNSVRVQQLTAELSINGQHQLRLSERLENQRRQLADLMPPPSPPPAPGLAVEEAPPPRPVARPASPTAVRIARLRQEISDLLSRYTERYPDVIQKRTELTMLEAQLAAEERAPQEPAVATAPPVRAPGSIPRIAPPPPPVDPNAQRLEGAIADTESELKVLREEERRLRAELGQFQARVDRAPLVEQEFQRISRDLATTKELYQARLRRTEDVQLADSIEQEQRGVRFRILEEAVPPKEAIGSRRLVFAMGALLIAAVVAGASALLAESLDSSFHSADELRQFSAVPVLVSIPRIATARDARRRRWGLAAFALALVCGVVVVAGSAYAVLGPRPSVVSSR
jgi:polysaccharide chain length determinant protein (PEP-CTERM system associated)